MTETKQESSTQQIPNIKPGMTVKVYQKIKEGKGDKEKERIQIYEGIVIAKKGGNNKNATITVRKISDGIGVEKIFPIYSPSLTQITPVKQAKVNKAKLYYLRNYKKRLKETKI